jgi:hypothetical protein
MDTRGLQRFAPLTGVAFVVLVVLAILIGGETPDNNDSRQTIVNFWKDHQDSQIWSDLIGAWATVFFVWFAATIRSALRPLEAGPARLSTLSFGGAVIGAVGLLSSLSINFATADAVDDVPAGVIQTLTILGNGFFLPIAAGFAIFFLAVGVLAVRSAFLPAWLGWLTILIGVACVTPVGFIALLVGLVWILAVSVMLFMRAAAPATTVDPAARTAAP